MERIEIEKEEEAWRTIDALFYSKEKKYKDEIQDMLKIIQGKVLILLEKDKALSVKDIELSEKDKVISKNAKIIEELMRKLGEK